MGRFLHKSKIKIFGIFLAFYLIILFFGFKQASASVSIYYNPAPPASNKVSDSFCSGVMQACWNSERVGITGCGTACTGGSPWTKYQYDSCYTDPLRPGAYTAYLKATSAVYSTADKCSKGQGPPSPAEPYLRPSNCAGSIGTTPYKTCCTNASPSLASRSSCVAVTPYSGAPYPPI